MGVAAVPFLCVRLMNWAAACVTWGLCADGLMSWTHPHFMRLELGKKREISHAHTPAATKILSHSPNITTHAA